MAGSLAAVARQAGVSIATASRVLNGSSHRVSARLQARVVLAAEEVGYAPSSLAQAFVSRQSPILGVIVGDVVDPFFAEVTRGVEDVAREARHLTIICDSDRRTTAELEYLRLLRAFVRRASSSPAAVSSTTPKPARWPRPSQRPRPMECASCRLHRGASPVPS